VAAVKRLAPVLSAYVLQLETRARDAETAQRVAEADAAQWRARYGEALYGWALAESTNHEVRTGHSIVVGSRLRCRDCSWAGRANPYEVAP
jgi:hypothetical protein